MEENFIRNFCFVTFPGVVLISVYILLNINVVCFIECCKKEKNHIVFVSFNDVGKTLYYFFSVIKIFFKKIKILFVLITKKD